MEEFEVPTYDQHLILNGKVLEGNQATLAELRVLAGNTIYLKVGTRICILNYIFIIFKVKN